jgi:hypothetical protein
MRMTEKHYAAIKILIAQQFDRTTREEAAEKIGITRNTLFRWLRDEDFQIELKAAQAEWRKSIEHIPLVHRRWRLEELQRMYDSLPIEGNQMVKAKLIEHVAQEVAGDVAEELEELKEKVHNELKLFKTK